MNSNSSYYVMVDKDSNEDIILNKDLFSELFEDGDYVRFYDVECSFNGDGQPSSSIILVVKASTFQSVKGRLEIIVSKNIADFFEIKPMTSRRFCIEKISPEHCSIDFVELSFKKQFLSRGNMWIFKNLMIGRPIYTGQNLVIGRIQAQIQEIGLNGIPKKTGIITKETNCIFRSRSTRIFWLVQISGEMWAHDENGDLYFDKFLYKFVAPLLDKWEALGVSHSLTIIFYSRTYRIKNKLHEGISETKSTTKVDYEDHFKVVIENSSDTDKIWYLRTLKREFWSFSADIGWRIDSSDINSRVGDVLLPSGAYDGNFLESINTTLNILSKHYMDRDLLRSGNSIVMISAGVGVFKVKPNLSLITKQRMMDAGIGIDFISLSQPPLHSVPLFHVDCSDEEVSDFYEMPHWINVSFVDCERDSSVTVESSGDGMNDLKPELKVQPNVKNYKWTGLSDFQIKSMKTVPSRKLITANETVDDRWGREFKPLPFATILAGHVSSTRISECQSNLPRPLLSLLTESLTIALETNCTEKTFEEWGCLPFSQRYQTLSLENLMLSNNALSVDDIHEYVCRLPKYRAGSGDLLRDNKNDSKLLKQELASEDLLIEIPIGGDKTKKHLSFDAKSFQELYKASLMSSSFASPKGKFLSNPYRSYFGTDMNYDSDIYLSSHLGNVDFCLESDQDDSNISQKLIQPIKTDLCLFDNLAFVSGHSNFTSSNSFSNGSPERKSVYQTVASQSSLTINDYGFRSPNTSRIVQGRSPERNDISFPKERAMPKPKTLSFGNTKIIGSTIEWTTDSSIEVEEQGRKKDDKCELPRNSKILIREFRNKAQSNPFRKEIGINYLNARTHNRRRWSYVFPTGKLGNSTAFYGLNWKSLTQPAILPITTDYIPSVKDLDTMYEVQSNYTFVMDTNCPYDNIENLLIEMVCQRLSMEYQFVQINDPIPYINFANGNHNGSLSQSKNRLSSSPANTSKFYILSMGHRIQFLTLEQEKQEIKVTLLLSKKGVNDNERTFMYNYKLWVPQLNSYVTTNQTFAQFPSEFPWNNADVALMGKLQLDLKSESNRAKRLRFIIIPKIISSAVDEVSVNFDFDRSVENNSIVNVQEEFFSGIEKLRLLLMKNVVDEQIKLTQDRDSKYQDDEWLHEAIVKLWFSGPGNNQPKWVFLKHDSRVSPYKIYHFELHWFACDAWIVEDFINMLFKKCTMFRIRIVQIPEFFSTSNLRVHPYRAQPYIPLITTEAQKRINSMYLSPVRLFENIYFLGDVENWIRDDSKITDWKSVGLPDSFTGEQGKSQLTGLLEKSINSLSPSSSNSNLNDSKKRAVPEIKLTAVRRNTNTNNQSTTIYKTYFGKIGIRSKTIPDRQYVHRQGFAAVRIGLEGIVWLLNTSARVNDVTLTLEEKKANAQRSINQLISKVSSVNICLEVIVEIIEWAMDSTS